MSFDKAFFKFLCSLELSNKQYFYLYSRPMYSPLFIILGHVPTCPAGFIDRTTSHSLWIYLLLLTKV